MIAPPLRRALARLGIAAVAAFASAAAPIANAPPLVYVERAPARDVGVVPGLGPGGSRLATAGRLVRLEPDGRRRDLLPRGRMWSVQDPDVSPDARRVVFSGRPHADSAWRLWVVSADGGEPQPLTDFARTLAGTTADDVDPCWFGDHVVFASTRDARGDLYDGQSCFDLWAIAPGGVPSRLTHEAIGALDPCVDPRTGRLTWTRGWFNPWRVDSGGALRRLTPAQAALAITWRVVSAEVVEDSAGHLALDDERLALGVAGESHAGSGLQPASLADGSWLATFAGNPALVPSPAGVGVQRFAPPLAAGRRVAGLAIDARDAPAYERAVGLAPPGACAPAALPGGDAVLSLDPGARGEFGLWRLGRTGEHPQPIVDAPGVLELDAAPIVRRPGARTVRVAPRPAGFAYRNRDVFAGRGAPARRDGARLRVFALAREGGRDTVRMLLDVPVPRNGRVHVPDLPEGVPMFEALLGADGRVLATAHGPAQVLGFNAGDRFRTRECRGCHRGHSARP